MSLINCPECSKQISDKSHYCINCGYPFDELKKNVDNAEVSKIPKYMLTTNDVAEYLGISKTTAYKLVHFRGFPKFMIGHRCFIKRDDFIKWVDDNIKSKNKILL
jgi:excisionase family DNA binding protein